MTDPVRYVTNSEMETFKECRRKWWLQYVRRLTHKFDDDSGYAARVGTLVHKALEDYYRTPRSSSDERAAVVSLIPGPSVDTEGRKEHELARTIVEGYFDWLGETGADADLDFVRIEEKISIPSQIEGIHLLGKMDLNAVNRETGELSIIDHKDQPLDSLVHTPNGWVRNGDLRVGDLVTDPCGGVGEVKALFPKGTQDVYRVTFTDGSTCEAGLGHLWEVRRYQKTNPVVVSTEVLASWLGGRHRPRILNPTVDLDRQELPVDPYVFGSWLGDGTSANGTFTIHTDDQEHFTHEIRRAGYETTVRSHPYTVGTIGLVSDLREIGVLNRKHVPVEYLLGRAEDRLALLQGLLDTDGHVRQANGSVLLVACNELIADAAQDIVRSLGGRASKTVFTNAAGNACWTVCVALPPGVVPFRLPRKRAEFLKRTRKEPTRTIKSIEFSRRTETQCISVTTRRNTYITNDYITTHNTTDSFGRSLTDIHILRQPKLYLLMQKIKNPDVPLHSVIWNLLKKSKRTSKSTPPYYMRYRLAINDDELRQYWQELHVVIHDMIRVEQEILEAERPEIVAYPTPSKDCSWKCQFFQICGQLDDPKSDHEYLINESYTTYDPLERYEDPKANQ